MTRIAIIGPGAIGGAIAAALCSTREHELVLCGRRPLEKLVVDTPNGSLTVPIATLVDPAEAPKVDWVLVATKAHDSAAIAGWLPHLRRENTPVAVLQNGVEHVARFARFVPVDQIVPVVVDLPAERLAADHIRQRGPGRLTVADDASGRAFAGLFVHTALAVTTTDDFPSAAWRKLCLNAAGVLSALLLQPAGIMRQPAAAQLARRIIREAMAVARAEGARLPDDLDDQILSIYQSAPADAVNSLHADRLAGRPTEIEIRNGVIVRLGQKHGIPTPCNAMAEALIKLASPPGTA